MERATIRDVAKKAGVSITTVSKALNDYPDVNPETRSRIQEIARQMNYVPNVAGRSMGGRVDKVIGLLINDLRPIDPSGSVYGILSGVCHACQDNNIEFILMTTDSRQQTQRTLKVLCLRKQLTGLICAGFRLHDPYLQQLDEIDIPCAFIDIRTSSPDVLNITMDNERADLLSYVNVFGYNPKYGVTGDRLPRVTYWPQHFNDYMQSPRYTLPARVKRRR